MILKRWVKFMKQIQHVFQDTLVSWAQETWFCNFIFFFLRIASEITEGSGSAKPSSVPVSTTESSKRDKGRWGSETSRMPGWISLGEFHSLQVTVRGTHFSVFCSSDVGTLWICQEFRIPLFTNGLSVCLVTEFDTLQKDQRPQYSDKDNMSGYMVMFMSRISHSTDPQDQSRDHDLAFCKELPWWQDEGGAVSPT